MSKHFFTSGHWQQTIPPRSNLMSHRVSSLGLFTERAPEMPPIGADTGADTSERASAVPWSALPTAGALEGLWASPVLAVSLVP